MKLTSPFPLAVLFVAFAFSLVSCKKETVSPGVYNGPDRIDNDPPIAVAGKDTTILLPVDSIHLDGSTSSDPNGNLMRFSWRQIWGATASIADSQSARTTAKGLSQGVYHFELQVTDKEGASAKDTLIVMVQPSSQVTGAYYSENLSWIFPWYATLEIKNIYAHVPSGRRLTVFIQRSFHDPWIEVPQLSVDSNNNTYEYFIQTRPDGASMYNYGSLYVFYYGTRTNDNPVVKVLF